MRQTPHDERDGDVASRDDEGAVERGHGHRPPRFDPVGFEEGFGDEHQYEVSKE